MPRSGREGVHQHPHPGHGHRGPKLANAEWRSWLTGCFCSMGSSWRSTQHWCLRWGAMEFHALVAHVDGAILQAARRRKERHYPELSGQQGRTRLVVVAAEMGGRWSPESVRFLVHFAKAKVRHEPKVMRVSAQCAWMRRWRCMLACAAAQAFALSLLDG